MSESVSSPFTAYNSTGSVRTLVGNWQEEAVLKDVTGASRTQRTLAQHQAAAEATVYAVRHDDALDEPTHPRVIEHTEQLLPTEWITHNTVNYQPPAARTFDLASYPKTKQLGTREEQELKKLWQEAAAEEPPVLAAATYETTNATVFKPHSLKGLQVGARVMKTPDGKPVQRDPTFLAETHILARSSADRLMSASKHSSTGDGGGCSASMKVSGLQSWMENPAVPVTLYTEAAAKATLTGHFYGTAILNKAAPMNRNDNFTKLMGDPNKTTDDQ